MVSLGLVSTFYLEEDFKNMVSYKIFILLLLIYVN